MSSTSPIETYEPVIGLEVHLQMKTATKIFCGCENSFGGDPNSRTCAVCLGFPGTLPVLNKKVLEYAIKIGLALRCQINPYIKFDRKNYYYPDLPKAYQISQYDFPVAHHGEVMIPQEDGTKKRIGITRAHMEEDAGKLIHDDATHCSLVDYNRTGTPLLEIVSDPDLRSPQEAYDYLTALKLTLHYLNVSDCDMEKGSLRCDANISIRPRGVTTLGTKTEIKNLNSFKAVRAALEHEITRHMTVIASGGVIVQETRLWDEAKAMTISMRSKEDAHDYRYFPEPDLVPFTVDETEIAAIRASIPELPEEKYSRFLTQYSLSEYNAHILVQDQPIAAFFEECAVEYPDTKKLCNWIIGELLKELNARKNELAHLQITPTRFVALLKKIDDGAVSNLNAKIAFTHMLDTGASADEALTAKGLMQVSDSSALESIIDDVITANAAIVAQIKAGKESAMGFLVGEAMKRSKGKANPKILGELLRRRLLHA